MRILISVSVFVLNAGINIDTAFYILYMCVCMYVV